MHRKPIFTAATSVAAKAFGMLVGFYYVRIAISYLGMETYGLWMTIASYVALLGFCDLGMSNVVVNIVAKHATEKKTVILALISEIQSVVLGVGTITFFIVMAWAMFLMPKNFFLGSNTSEHRFVVILVIGLTLLQILNTSLGITQKIRVGLQQGYINNIWGIVGGGLNILLMLIASKFSADYINFIFAASLGVAIANILNTFTFYERSSVFLGSVAKKVDRSILPHIRSGSNFLVLWLVNTVGLSLDKIIISRYFTDVDVASYSLVEQMFSVMVIVQFITMPYWPAFTSARKAQKNEWVKKTFIRILVVAMFLSTFICAILIFFGDRILEFWIGKPVILSSGLLISYGLFRVIGGFNEAVMPIMLNQDFVKTLMKLSCIAALTSITLKILLLNNDFGISIIPIISAASYFLFIFVPGVYVSFRNINLSLKIK